MSQKDVTQETIVKKEATIQPTSCAIMQEVRALKAPVEQNEHTLEHESAILDEGRALFWRFGVITPIGHSSLQGGSKGLLLVSEGNSDGYGYAGRESGRKVVKLQVEIQQGIYMR